MSSLLAPGPAGPKSGREAGPPVGHLPRLDLLRGVAILLVLVVHALLQLTNWPHLELIGLAGVSLFFVLSGFCIHLTATKLLARSASAPAFTREFLWRRFWRIYPPYLAALLVFTLMERRHVAITARDFWWHAVLAQNLNPSTFSSINASFWSISVEWHFYLLYPLLLVAWRRYGATVALWSVFLLSLSAGVCGLLLPASQTPLSTLTLFFEWTLGVWLADAWLNGRSTLVLERLAPWSICLALPTVLSHWTEPLCFLFYSIGFSGVVARLLRNRSELNLAERGLVGIGLCSYSLYLWHQPLLGRILYWAHRIVPYRSTLPAELLVSVLVSLPVLVGLAWLSYRFLEQPAMAIGHHVIWKRSRER